MLIRRFFKDMPKKFNENGKWELKTFKFIHQSFGYQYYYHNGKLGIAYIKVRLLAWFRDLSTSGEGTGIAWSIKKIE